MQETATQFRDTIMSRIQFGDCKINSFVVTYKISTLCTLRDMLLEQPEPEAKQIALSLELYTTGSLDIFGKQSNVDLDKCVVVRHSRSRFPAQAHRPAGDHGHHAQPRDAELEEGQAHPCLY